MAPPTPPCESNPSPCLDLRKSCVPEQKEHLGLALTHALPQTWDVNSGSMMELQPTGENTAPPTQASPVGALCPKEQASTAPT